MKIVRMLESASPISQGHHRDALALAVVKKIQYREMSEGQARLPFDLLRSL